MIDGRYLFGEVCLEGAEIVGEAEGRWVVQSDGGRRYFLYDHQIKGPVLPQVGRRGELGYVQGLVTAQLTMVLRED